MLTNLNLLGMYVTNLAETLDFYQKLGFKATGDDKDNRDVAYVKLGDFRLQFIAKDSAKDKPEAFQKDAFGEPKGTGLYINVQVTGIDEYYQTILQKGLKPSTEPRDWPWGQREFVVRDPDGYKLVFYQVIA